MRPSAKRVADFNEPQSATPPPPPPPRVPPCKRQRGIDELTHVEAGGDALEPSPSSPRVAPTVVYKEPEEGCFQIDSIVYGWTDSID